MNMFMNRLWRRMTKDVIAASVQDQRCDCQYINCCVNEAGKRTFYLSVAALLFSFVSFAFVMFKPSCSLQHNIVVVDMNALLRQKAATLLQTQNKNQSESKRESELFEHARHIRSHIEQYAQIHNVTVIAKGVVFDSNLKDVTHDIAAIM